MSDMNTATNTDDNFNIIDRISRIREMGWSQEAIQQSSTYFHTLRESTRKG